MKAVRGQHVQNQKDSCWSNTPVLWVGGFKLNYQFIKTIYQIKNIKSKQLRTETQTRNSNSNSNPNTPKPRGLADLCDLDYLCVRLHVWSGDLCYLKHWRARLCVWSYNSYCFNHSRGGGTAKKTVERTCAAPNARRASEVTYVMFLQHEHFEARVGTHILRTR